MKRCGGGSLVTNENDGVFQEESLTVRAEFVALSTEWKSSEEARPLITFFFFVSFWFKHNWIQTIFKLNHQTNIKMTE